MLDSVLRLSHGSRIGLPPPTPAQVSGMLCDAVGYGYRVRQVHVDRAAALVTQQGDADDAAKVLWAAMLARRPLKPRRVTKLVSMCHQVGKTYRKEAAEMVVKSMSAEYLSGMPPASVATLAVACMYADDADMLEKMRAPLQHLLMTSGAVCETINCIHVHIHPRACKTAPWRSCGVPTCCTRTCRGVVVSCRAALPLQLQRRHPSPRRPRRLPCWQMRRRI